MMSCEIDVCFPGTCSKGTKHCPIARQPFAVSVPADAEENLLLDTLVRIRIATGLIKPMLTELPGEVRILMNELRELRSVAHRALELYERWESEHDPDTCQFAEWDGLKDALKSAGALPA